MATPGENRSWKSGQRKGARKKKAKPQVLGLVVTICCLAAVLLWAIWPRPMIQVQLFVIGPDEEVQYDGERLARYLTAQVDNKKVFTVFSQLADQVQSVVAAREIPVTKFKGMSADELNGKRKVGIFFLNAWSRVVVDDDQKSQLQFQFGTDRQSITFDELVKQLDAAKFREVILLLEVSHERPDFSSGLLAVEGTALLYEEVSRLKESLPDLKLTVISSAEPLHSSYPHIVSAKEIPDLEDFDADREVILGTVFGHAVSEVFRAGDFWAIEELGQRILSRVESDVSKHFQRGNQNPGIFSTYASDEPVSIFREKHVVLATSEPEETEDDASEEEQPPEKDAAEEEVQQTPDEKLVEFRTKIRGIVNSHELATISIGDLTQLNQYSSDMKYCLDHAALETFDEILGQGERLVLQIQSAAKSGSDVLQAEEIQQWVSPVAFEATADSAFFSEVLAEVNEGEDQRSASIVEKLKSQEAREQLVASFLAVCERALEGMDIDSPEAKMLRVGQLAEWRTFFQRLARKAGWHDSEWPHQFLVTTDLLRGVNGEWTDAQFAAFLRLQSLRSEGIQFAAGWNRDGKNRLNQQTFQLIEPQLQQLLTEVMAAERWFLLDQNAVEILEKHLLAAEKSLGEIKLELGEASDRYDFLTQQRLKIVTAIEKIALQHNSVMLSPDQFASLARLSDSDLQKFAANNFPQASFSREVSRDDAIALLQLTTRLTARSPRQQMNETESAMARFGALGDASKVLSVSEEYQDPMVHQGVWLGFWSVRALQALSGEADVTSLMTAWVEFVQAIADEKDAAFVATKRAVLAHRLRTKWESISPDSVVLFQAVAFKNVTSLISRDLERHAKLAGSRYSGRYRKIFNTPISNSSTIRLPLAADEIKINGGKAELNMDIPEGSQVYFYADGVRLDNSNFRDMNGWQVGPWSSAHRGLRATPQFSGSATPVIAVVNKEGVVQDFQRLHIGVAFEATGWKVRFSSNGIRIPEIDLSDNLKVIKLPPQSSEAPLPVMVQLIQPENSFANSVLVNIAPLNDVGEPGKNLWSQFHELTLDRESKTVVIPLSPPVPEGETSPVLIPEAGVDFTRGMAFIVRSKDAVDRKNDIVLRVTPKFFNPLDQYLELGELAFDTARHRLSVPIRRRANIPLDVFPPKKIGAELNFSLDLDPYSLNPPPKRPEITEDFEILEAGFSPGIQEAIRVSETTIGKDRLEFGLSVDGLDNIAKWRLGQSEKMERVGYARSGNANQFGNRTEIRIGMNLTNKEDEGVQTHNLDGLFVLGEKWRNAVLDLPLELYGYQAEQANASRLELTLLEEGKTEPSTLASEPIVDAYERSLKVNSEESGVWQLSMSSKPHGKFGLNLFENFNVTEGTHRLVATLKDENDSQPIAKYQTEFVIEDSAPSIEWKSENAKQILTSQNYKGWVSVKDPQTGVVSISVGLDKEAMTKIDLKSNRGERRSLKVPVIIDKLRYPEIAAKNVPIRKRVTVHIQATNSIGMVASFSEDIVLIQPAANMSPSGKKTGTLLVKISSKGAYDLVLTGDGGKVKREVPDAKGTARFDDLPEGNYKLSWKKNYDSSKGSKPVTLKFSKTGAVVDLAL